MEKQDDLFSGDLFSGDETKETVKEPVETTPEVTQTLAVEVVTDVVSQETVSEAASGQTLAQAEESLEENTEEDADEATTSDEPPSIPLQNRPVQTGDDGEQLTLAHFASHAYLEYAMSVVKGRALPDVGDGQKPVQRRILFDMHEMGLRFEGRPVKSARVVGDVLGKYHPHGDTAAYDAMVRMAQEFNMRYPLVNGQGNFGSRDGDGAAAMRYTEAKLTKISRLLLDELNEGTVDFLPNYDGNYKEPAVLPARLPFVLLNGASGIAVGMATELLPHNLREVAKACLLLLEKPEATLDEVLNVMPAPDFPMGGQIISRRSDIAEAYRTGRGSIKVRARYQFEELQRGHWRLIVTELPPNTSAQRVLNEIGEITNPKVRPGKKALSADQQQAKAAMLAILENVRDEADKDHPMRLVFEPKSKNVNREEFVNALLSQTSMEGNVSMNMVMVGLDGKPCQKSLLDILGEWVTFRRETVRRRTQFRLQKANDRIHILEGRHLVYLNLDEVIAIIRDAEDPKVALMERFPLSEVQAEDILEIRLRQLARLAGIKIEAELAELNKERSSLERLLGSEKLLTNLVAKEITKDCEEFGDDRRTLVEEADRAEMTQAVLDEPVTVIISQKGFIRARTGHGHDASIMSYKMGDAFALAIECRTTDNMVALADNGRVYTIAVADLPSARGDGLPINSFVDLEAGSKLLSYCVAKPDDRILMSLSDGYGFICQFKDMCARLKAGKNFVKPNPDARLLPPQIVRDGQEWVACLSEFGRLTIFKLEEIRHLPGGGKGVVLMNLADKETLVAAKPITQDGVVVFGTGRGAKERDYVVKKAIFEYHLASRARKGKALDIRWTVKGLRDLPQKTADEAPEEEAETKKENMTLI